MPMEKGSIIMKIQAVLIDGFKNLSNVRINFDNITALVSLNNFGKSNVLSAIDFGLTYIKSNIEDKIDMMGRDKSIISLSKEIKKRHFIKVQKQEDVNPKLKWKMQSVLISLILL